MRYVCVDVQISISTWPRTGNLLSAFLPFPHPFCLSQQACSLPKHRNTFLTLPDIFASPDGGRTKNASILVKRREAAWVCFTQPFPEGNAEAEYMDENAQIRPWGLASGGRRGAAVPASIRAGGSRLAEMSQVVFETVRTH